MKILILSQYYPPETGACANRISGFARHLTHHGHEVTVMTGFPNYPIGKLYPGFKREWCQKGQDGRVRLIRTWLSIRNPNRPLHRLMSYLGFFFSSLWASVFISGKQDIVVATSGPILVGFGGALVSWLRRKTFVLDLRDVWPERIVAAGEFKNPIALKILEWVEKFIYWRADRIVCVTQGLRSRLLEKGIAAHKLSVITNGTDTSLFHGNGANGEVLEALGIRKDAFVVVYAGTLGLLQDHELILKTAEKVKDMEDVCLLIIGDGVRRDYLEQEAKKRGLKNLRVIPSMPREKLAGVLSAAKIGINMNTNIQHNQMAIPVKMFDYMASRLPVVIANQGEVERIVGEGGAGICTPPGNRERFLEAIMRLHNDPSLRLEMGKRGRALVESRYSMAILASQFEENLKIPAASKE